MAHSLRDQGFRIESPCENAQSVRVAYFRQKGGAFYGPYPMEADIAWEQDERGRLLWTKGHVFFVGP